MSLCDVGHVDMSLSLPGTHRGHRLLNAELPVLLQELVEMMELAMRVRKGRIAIHPTKQVAAGKEIIMVIVSGECLVWVSL